MIRVTIGGEPYNLDSYEVSEAATPLAGGDTTGQVGSIDLSILRPDPDLAVAVPGPIVSWTETARNIATNPNVTAATAAYANDPSVHNVQWNVAVSDHPQGITTAVRSNVQAGKTSSEVASFYDLDGLAGSAPNRYLGAWVKPSRTLRAYWGAGGIGTAIPVPANVWTWVPSTLYAATAYSAFYVATPDGSNVTPVTDSVLVTGFTALTTGPPTETIWGGRTSPNPEERYRWLGTANASASVFEFAVRGPATTSASPINLFGPGLLVGQEVRLVDDTKGVTLGNVTSVSDNSGALVTVNCVSRLGKLNVYNIQSDPFVGTLGDAFDYYLSLANIEVDLFTDEAIRNRPVIFPGWNGELWYYLKQMAASQDCDISLVSGVILLRPVRTRTAVKGKNITSSHDIAQNNLAQFVEVYRYSNRQVTNELIYPTGGWNSDVEVLTVAAGESVEQTLEISASLSSIVQPIMLSYVSEGYNTGSVYTIVADDGLPVNPALWAANGGRLSVAINADTVSLTVFITGATNIPTSAGEASKNFSVALASDYSGNRYSTLRLIGSGVAYEKEKVRFSTGLTAQQTATEVGLTIDNPFLTTMNQMYTIGTRAARRYSGHIPELSGSVTEVNRAGENGGAQYPTYGQVQTTLNSPTPRTYAQVQSSANYVGKDYQQIKDYWFETVRNEFANQVFGNVGGLRIHDTASKRFYRVREATIRTDRIEYTGAEDDLTHGDMQPIYAGKTYAQVKAINTGLTYKQSNLAGMIGA